MEPKAVNDLAVVAAQLGRTPRGAFSTVVRCSYGYPQVICVHPVVAGKPFPTLYWLTCPFLSREIGRREAAGWVKKMEARMMEEDELRASMHQAHERICRQRDALLSEHERAALAANGMLVGLEGRGIGGIMDWNRLKCLHLHVAHALADENAVGSIILAMLPMQECSSLKVICSAYE